LDPDDPVDFTQTEIYVMDPLHPELERVQLTDNAYEERGPAWSPDATKIAFAANIGPLNAQGDPTAEICVLDVSTGEIQRLTFNSVPDLTPTWSPDGTQIAFQHNVAGLPQIFVMDADGTDQVQITSAPGRNQGSLWGEIWTKIEDDLQAASFVGPARAAAAPPL
jgi:Tol biopolymer transport system component